MITILLQKNTKLSEKIDNYLKIKRVSHIYQILFSSQFSKQIRDLKIELNQFTKDIASILNSNPTVGEENDDGNLEIPLKFMDEEYLLEYSLGNWQNNILTLENITLVH